MIDVKVDVITVRLPLRYVLGTHGRVSVVVRADLDPNWWLVGTHDGRSIRDILRIHDMGALFGFLGARGWSRAAIASATGLTESRVRSVRQGKQQITSYDVLVRIADGLGIARGLMGLAYTDDKNASHTAGMVGQVGPMTAKHPIDGVPMVCIDEGVFPFGPDDQLIWLPAFYIDSTQITNAQYSQFVAATDHRPPIHWGGKCCPEELCDHPVVNVTHYDASAYAAWAGKLLPTETEWEKAARGPRGFRYPWGNQATPAKCNVREAELERTTPVGLYRSGASPYGVYDMAGNVWEWCRTETAANRYVLKGGAFTSPFTTAAASATNDAAATMFDDDTGFRCVCTGDQLVSA
jgi:formylglycine-generating enzyme required for sulfatase activity